MLSSNLRVSGRSVLLVIDAQNDICHPAGEFARSGKGVNGIKRAFENGILPMVEKARSCGISIGFIRAEYKQGQFEAPFEKLLTVNDSEADSTWRIRIYLDLPKNGDAIFRKSQYEPFHFNGIDNGLADWLAGNVVEGFVLVAGFTTDNCVKAGVNALVERRYAPVVLEDCVSTRDYKIDDGTHYRTISRFREHNGIYVVQSGAVELIRC
ncbi:TPA: cysteine hydrolase [Candidatus Micrarchaeota archaeon]|nr:cysteine hydrolase [Candidatus Micrarchaeota archaeon]